MEAKQKKILLLGGSAQQVIAIQKAKELGYYTVLCDYLPDNPGQYEADKYYNISTTNVDAVYEVAKNEGVSGILAYASDPAALPAAIVCERLGLPTNPAESVAILGVKHKFREFLSTHGFPCPKAYSFNPSQNVEEIADAINDFSFPVVVKPTDSSGSKGVSTLQTIDALGDAIKFADSYSRNKILIVEEFIHRGFPDVIGGDIFVWDGKIVLYGEMSCLRGKGGKGLIPIGEKKPSLLNEKQTQRVHEELQRIVTELGICFGELNLEILMDDEDVPHFLELGPRAGGNMIPIQLSDAFGVDLVKANVLAAMGENPEIILNPQAGCFMTYVLHSYEDGIFSGVMYNPEISEYVYRETLYKQPGDTIEAFDGAGKAVGVVFLKIPTLEKMLDIYEKMEDLIKVISK